MSAVDGQLDKINADRVAKGQPCTIGLCGRPGCPTCESQSELREQFWALRDQGK